MKFEFKEAGNLRKDFLPLFAPFEGKIYIKRGKFTFEG